MELFRVGILGTAAVANIGVALIVFFRNRRSSANRAFAAAVLAIQFWLTLDFLASEPSLVSYMLPLNRATPAAGMLMGALLLYFALAFTKQNSPLSAGWWAFFAFGGALMGVTLLTDRVVAGITVASTSTGIVFGPLFPLFVVWALAGVVTMITVFFRGYRRATGRLRTQIRYMLLGAALFASSAILFGLIVPMITGWLWFSRLVALSSILLVGFTAYAMIKHRLMDVRLVVLRSAVYAVLVVAVGAIMLIPSILVGAAGPGAGSTANAVAFSLGLVAVLAFQPIRHVLERATDGFLYRRTYDPASLLSHLGTAMSATLEIDDLAYLLARELAANMRLSFAAVAYVRGDIPTAVGDGVTFDDTDARQLLNTCRGGGMVVADDLQDSGDCALVLREHQVRVLAPLVMDGTVLGALTLGPKRSGEIYSSQDIRFLEILGSEAALALKNAHLFDEKTQRVRELTALNELAHALGQPTELGSVLDAAMHQVMAVTAADSGSIMLLEKGDMTFRIVASRGIAPRVVSSSRSTVDEGIAGWVAKNRQPLILVDDTDPRFRAYLKRGEIVSAISAPIIFKDTLIGVLNVNRRSADLFTSENLNVVTSFAAQLGVVIENARLFAELESTTLGTIEALAAAVDAKDPYTFGHSRAVTDYSVAIALRMDLPEQEVQTLRIAATLHDIGKIGVEGSILNKNGPLTSEEWSQIRRHPTIAADILGSLEFLRETVPLILFHHERYGGGGYPSGVSGETIPLGARIISVADSFNAMTSDRPYRRAMSVEQAKNELVVHSGTQFDPDVVEAFIDALSGNGHAHRHSAKPRLRMRRAADGTEALATS